MASEQTLVASHFDNLAQQHRATGLGTWVFLVTEMMFFGALFTAYAVHRVLHEKAFAAASNSLDLILGTVNTAVLLTSSFTMAMGVRSASQGRRRMLVGFLGITLLLGMVFLGIKGLEYVHKVHEGLFPGTRFRGSSEAGFQTFFTFYFAMTGMHALHMVIGVVLLGVLTGVALRRRTPLEHTAAFEIAGLYWHFVDIVWIFLFPLLYLLGRHP